VQRTRRVHLARVGTHPGDQFAEGVVAAAGVLEQITLEAAGVRQKLADRHGLAHRPVADTERRQVATHRGVELHHALGDQLHHQRRGPHLGDRTDLEHAVHRRRHTGIAVDHARGRLDQLPTSPDRDNSTRHAMTPSRLIEQRLKVHIENRTQSASHRRSAQNAQLMFHRLAPLSVTAVSR
jgi:hypothetical protein